MPKRTAVNKDGMCRRFKILIAMTAGVLFRRLAAVDEVPWTTPLGGKREYTLMGQLKPTEPDDDGIWHVQTCSTLPVA